MSKTFSSRILLTTAASCIMLQAAPAMAQVDEIIITARKREESAMKVPVVATALNAEQLEQFATNDVLALTQRVPSLIGGTNAPGLGFQISLRGVGTSVISPAIDQSVSLNVDGLGLSQGHAFQASNFDMASIEVLRGPQSLYFGKNATAGIIVVNTANPTDEFELITRGSYEFEAKEKVGEIIVSGPVTDKLGLRLAARYSAMDGYFDNLAVGDGVSSVTPKNSSFPHARDLVIRGTALWEPSDDFDATLKVNYTRYEREGVDDNDRGNCPEGPIAGVFGQFLAPNDNCKIDKTFYTVSFNPALYNPGMPGGGEPFNDITSVFGSLQLNYDLTPQLNLASVTGVFALEDTSLLNGPTSGFAGPTLVPELNFYRRDITQEVRLTSDFDFPVNFMVGAYYQDGFISNSQRLNFRTDPPFGAIFTGALGGTDIRGIQEIGIETISGFGQISVKPIEIVEFTAGARWTQETRELDAFNLLASGWTHVDVLGGLAVDRIRANNLSPEFTVTITPTDDLTLFASYREAFKSGSFNVPSPPAPGSNPSFGDESVQGWEAGIKSRFFDRSLSVNLSGYTYKYSDLQVGGVESTSTITILRTLNAGSADVHGVDLDIAYQPPQIDGLNVFVTANWNDATYGAGFNNATCWDGQTAAAGCNQFLNPATGRFTAQDLSGKPLVRAPKYTASFGFNYERPFANGQLVWGIGSSTLWSDSYATYLQLREDTFQGSYFKTNLNLTLKDADGAWELALIGKNLTDEITSGICSIADAQNSILNATITGSPVNAVGPSGLGEVSCRAERPREVWVRVTLRPMELINR